ncbi:hypothetical protein EUGRSUZ_C01051 [Eucalyptus grandis]|uniref:Uncharacterized protein n=2 Tax=Eucalyptus grandis TaxID=71139 RepID=A0ACC3LD35_EUCGR|nr:hypothetical protein EUGRSUZ_C01051 [Eucalyptus grandis]
MVMGLPIPSRLPDEFVRSTRDARRVLEPGETRGEGTFKILNRRPRKSSHPTTLFFPVSLLSSDLRPGLAILLLLERFFFAKMNAVRSCFIPVIVGFMFLTLLQLGYGQSMVPSPAPEGPSNDGMAIDQGIAYTLLLVALAVTYLFH